MIAGPSATGGELVLEQQQYLLAKTTLSPAEQQTRVDLQKRIQAAVLGTGKWDDIPAPLRTQAETPWFRSFLAFSPSQVMSKVKQPILIIQGDLDRQVVARHADALGTLAKARKKVAGGSRAGHAPRWRQSPAGAGEDRGPRGVPAACGEDGGPARGEDGGGLARVAEEIAASCQLATRTAALQLDPVATRESRAAGR
jgi:fermentation-respiration switch protein FrsA (DUF1100 family)